MKKIYTNVSYILVLLLVTAITSCGEPEDLVVPQVTCDTMATVHNEPGKGIQLILEDGRILAPANATTRADKEEVTLEISGFPVKEGQRIIMGYKSVSGNSTAGQVPSGKKIDVNCIVGITQKNPL